MTDINKNEDLKNKKLKGEDLKTQIGTSRDVLPETLEEFKEKLNAAFQDFSKGWSFKGVRVVDKPTEEGKTE